MVPARRYGGWLAPGWALLGAALWIGGCAPLPPSPADLQARRFEAVPGKAVIYLVRDYPDFSDQPATLWLGDTATITSYAGTYYRWEAPPGLQTISGFGPDSGSIRLAVEAGRVYFVQQRYVRGVFPFPQSHFQLVSADQGRAVVSRSELIGGR